MTDGADIGTTVSSRLTGVVMQKGEPMDDLISRAAVVDAIDGVDWYHINENGKMVHGANDTEHQAWYKADDIYAAIERVPSAQPVAKDINVPVKDCISRRAAIDAVNTALFPKINTAKDAEKALRNLPSAQPGWIPCSERLPEERINPNTRDFEYVLCVTIWGDVRPFKYGTPIGQKEAHFWNGAGYVDAYVTHWMPLPEPYKGDEDG